jgi:hypothetical protein
MNREIKYRAWDGKQMHHSPALSEGAQHLASWFEAHSVFGPEGKESVFMDFSGISDKKGKEVYEGDIIDLSGKYKYKVVFEDAKFVCYHLTNPEWGRWGDLRRLTDSDFIDYRWEVIGNIYENPELLNKIQNN